MSYLSLIVLLSTIITACNNTPVPTLTDLAAAEKTKITITEEIKPKESELLEPEIFPVYAPNLIAIGSQGALRPARTGNSDHSDNDDTGTDQNCLNDEECDDDNVCTDNTCDPANGCVYAPNTISCDDGYACTDNDTCSDGNCEGAPVTPCCGNETHERDEQCDDGNTIDGDGCSAGCLIEIEERIFRRAFRTSIRYDGNLGGVAGADIKCQERAEAAELNCPGGGAGCWQAWIADSDPASAPASRFAMASSGSNIGIYQVKSDLSGDPDFDDPIATGGWNDLILCGQMGSDPAGFCLDDSDEIFTSLIGDNSSWKDEFGQRISNEPDRYAYTNVSTNGTGYNIGSLHCNNWTSNSSSFNGYRGQVTEPDESWTIVGNSTCDTSLFLYCFEDFGPPIKCSNGITETGEECDDGNTMSGDGCSATCVEESCGDGVLQVGLGETCDDGNTLPGDGCSATCVEESCGDGVLQVGLGEECDDGNTLPGDGCSATCVEESCGDGVLQVGLGEECDDGNTMSGDGCSAACQREIIASRAFVTEGKYNGNLGGISGADAICQAQAATASLSCQNIVGVGYGCWKAWVAIDNNTGPNMRFDMRLAPSNTRPIYQVDTSGNPDPLSPIATGGFADLVQCSFNDGGFIGSSPSFCLDDTGIPINGWRNQHGIAGAPQQPAIAWTSVRSDGLGSGIFDCNDWTSNLSNSFGERGFFTNIGFTWSQESGQLVCTNELRLYCFEDF